MDSYDKTNTRTRKPAVAGQFYSDNATRLAAEIKDYCLKGKKLGESPTMLICPHAGYVFSGPVAGIGYATLDKNIKTVIVIGPSHHAWFNGVSIADVDSFNTPLGNVSLNVELIKKLRLHSIVHSEPQADEPEHSIEVQLPFLQTVLTQFTIVPIVTGNVEPAQVADLLLPFVDGHTIVIASSDLSHYQSNSIARKLDDASIQTIISGNETGSLDACGETPIRIVMHLAKKLSLSPVLLDARTSYDVAPQFGAQGRVVGYASIAYVKE